MTQTTSSRVAPTSSGDRILCCYNNLSDRLQILRISHIPQGTFAAIVFPHQRYLFTAECNAILEIHPTTPSSAPVQHIPCLSLRVKDSASPN
jgi:hypothetical protein